MLLDIYLFLLDINLFIFIDCKISCQSKLSPTLSMNPASWATIQIKLSLISYSITEVVNLKEIKFELSIQSYLQVFQMGMTIPHGEITITQITAKPRL